MKNNIMKALLNFFLDFFKINKDAYKMYQEQKILANDNRSVIANARFALAILILSNCIVRILIPLGLIILIIVGLFKILIPLLAIWIAIYIYLDERKNEKEQLLFTMQHIKMEQYELIASFSFDSFRSLGSWIPIKNPQAIRDIYCKPYYIFQGVHEFMVFKLLKLSADKIDDEKLIFAQKMLSSLLEDRLFEEHKKNPYGQFIYKGVPSLYVVCIEDKGDHLFFKIAFINNDQIYSYITNQSQNTIQRDTSKFHSDEDF